MMFKKVCAVLLAVTCVFCCVSCNDRTGGDGPTGTTTPETPGGTEIPKYDEMNEFEFTVSQLAGTDSLGRKLSPTTQSSNGKYVGLFYNVNNSEANYSGTTGIYDITKLMENYDSITEWLAKGKSKDSYYDYNPVFNRSSENKISPNGQTHWYAEPLYGYYSNADPWVIRKQMELLGLIGVDFIIIDLTNYPFYFDTSVNAVLSTLAEMTKEGVTVPKATIMLPYKDNEAEEMLNGVFSRFYNNEAYEDVWFVGGEDINPVGKPMVIGGFDALDKTHWERFVFPKQMQWPTLFNRRDALPWMDYGDKQFNHNGIMSVSISQTNGWASSAYLNADKTGFHARGWTYGDSTAGYDKEKVYAGANFEQQWQYAMSGEGGDVHTVIVTGWNEWGMRKLGLGEVSLSRSKAGVYVDQFDTTFSRECEMLAGEYGDNYVFQLATNIRKFKGLTVSEAIQNEKCTLDYESANDWAKLSRKYVDAVGETTARNRKTFASVDLTYTDTTNRNDIAYLKMANDAEYLYVQVACTNNITPYKSGDTSWMNLYLATGTNGWENYSYVINGTPASNGVTTIERLTSDALGKPVRTAVQAAADHHVSGKTITFRIPLAAIGVSSGTQIQVKAADNVGGSLAGGNGTPFRESLYGNAWDFYLYGDVAPAGRLNYAYKTA